jgi:alpha-galactosidase
VLGLYRVLEELTRRFPEVLFEGCAGGGGRFDAGMLFYMPQIWTSDNTDAVDRLFIQYGTSLAYPPVTMGAHISAVPNHQVGRITPLETRAAVALSANFGLELDLRKLSAAERANVAGHVAVYKQHRRLVQFGRFLRLESPFEGNRGAWQFVSEDRREVLVVLVRVLAGGAAAARAATIRAGLPGGAVGSPGRRRTEAPLRLRGLAEDAAYRDEKSGRRYTAAMLEAGGLPVELPPGDYASALWYLTREP